MSAYSYMLEIQYLGEDLFEIAKFVDWDGTKFPLHYDLPVTKYPDNQKPWLYDFLLQ